MDADEVVFSPISASKYHNWRSMLQSKEKEVFMNMINPKTKPIK